MVASTGAKRFVSRNTQINFLCDANDEEALEIPLTFHILDPNAEWKLQLNSALKGFLLGGQVPFLVHEEALFEATSENIHKVSKNHKLKTHPKKMKINKTL